MGGITINVYDRNQALNSQDCIRTYFEIVDEIQGRIAAFEEKEHADFHEDWEQLIKYINEQKNELKICYDRKLLEIHLNSNEDIIRFYRKCNANPKCRNYILPQDKELIKLKDGTEAACGKDRDCVKKVKATKEKASEGTSQQNEKGSRMQTLETQKSQGPNGNPIDGKESRQKQVISQDPRDVISLRPSVEPNSDGSEPKGGHHSSDPGPTDIPIQRLGVPPQPIHSVLGSNPDNPSPQSGSEGESPPTGITQEKTPETIAHQRDSHDSQTLNDNAHGGKSVDSQTDKTHPPVDGDVSVDPNTENLAEGTSVSGKHDDGDSLHTVANRVGNERTSVPPVGTANVGSGVVASGDTPPGLNGIKHGTTISEGDVTKAADNASTDSKSSDDAILDAGDKQGKPPGREKPHNNDPSQVLSGGTSCTKVLPNGQKIQCNQDSSVSVSNSAELQRGNSTQSEPHTEQEATGRESQLQKEKTQIHEKSNQEVHSDMEHHSQTQQLQNQEGHQGSTQGLHHGNQETSGERSQDNRSEAGDTGEAVTTGSGNVLDIINSFFRDAPYKEYSMMALVPLAIILLLTFLIKFTPLGTLFTKKKMNEKLQRVLSEYPTQRDERNIPFSYSPFAYSTQ
ncbi:PIR protein [Plasmodium vivax]|uniref:VIR protein n=1 Tax=Plasmodium vivax TaxID=5855 RepID=A0A564ZZR6_PLAVI|nr:PIR protein [Plasmodium vivax]